MEDYTNLTVFDMPVIDVAATSNNLKRLRCEHNITVAALQKVFLMENPQSIYNWENPDKKLLPRLDNLVVLAQLYKVSINELVVLKIVRTEYLAVREPLPTPFGVSAETVAFIKQNASADVREALERYFECGLG